MKYIKLFENFDESDLKEIELEIKDIFLELEDDGLEVYIESYVTSGGAGQGIEIHIEPSYFSTDENEKVTIKESYLDLFNHFFSYIKENGFNSVLSRNLSQ